MEIWSRKATQPDQQPDRLILVWFRSKGMAPNERLACGAGGVRHPQPGVGGGISAVESNAFSPLGGGIISQKVVLHLETSGLRIIG
ncbi:Hypothetical protein NTJ_13140 [Nesidiocoris tenuis]|uniref:Uncharacterized protein n=1 Tax=Nesidiocoris tenuis TaxID=355587 RepID=A0ABN7B9L1_9HEMI|nr:Hypothetical protein NTJ_13140 [Nesidiocoris tenuis]